MSDQSAFNQNQVAENAYVEPSGVLDQLNLSPSVVGFIRKNKRALQVGAISIAVVVITGSVYKSYHTSRLENGAASLAISMEAEGTARITALQQVTADYSGTPSALWADVELGHQAMKDGDFAAAEKYYQQVLTKTSDSNPLYGLLTFGVAQAQEAGARYDAASASYSALKDIDGYKDEGFMGMARVLEADSKNSEALAVYEEYLGSFLGEKNNPQLIRMIKEKITRLSSE
jgi:predicted negative regulator of RcsB-dependent stress response